MLWDIIGIVAPALREGGLDTGQDREARLAAQVLRDDPEARALRRGVEAYDAGRRAVVVGRSPVVSFLAGRPRRGRADGKG